MQIIWSDFAINNLNNLIPGLDFSVGINAQFSNNISITENISAVTTVIATDEDAAHTLSYSISGTDVDDFTINSSSGVLTFTSAPNFEVPTDSDGDNQYTVIDVEKSAEPQVTEFFSFYCPHCYQFEPIMQSVEHKLPEGTSFKKMHVDFLNVFEPNIYLVLDLLCTQRCKLI